MFKKIYVSMYSLLQKQFKAHPNFKNSLVYFKATTLYPGGIRSYNPLL
jgi:hypothetical protein